MEFTAFSFVREFFVRNSMKKSDSNFSLIMNFCYTLLFKLFAVSTVTGVVLWRRSDMFSVRCVS